jgi:hypothetical protein
MAVSQSMENESWDQKVEELSGLVARLAQTKTGELQFTESATAASRTPY